MPLILNRQCGESMTNSPVSLKAQLNRKFITYLLFTVTHTHAHTTGQHVRMSDFMVALQMTDRNSTFLFLIQLSFSSPSSRFFLPSLLLQQVKPSHNQRLVLSARHKATISALVYMTVHIQEMAAFTEICLYCFSSSTFSA